MAAGLLWLVVGLLVANVVGFLNTPVRLGPKEFKVAAVETSSPQSVPTWTPQGSLRQSIALMSQKNNTSGIEAVFLDYIQTSLLPGRRLSYKIRYIPPASSSILVPVLIAYSFVPGGPFPFPPLKP